MKSLYFLLAGFSIFLLSCSSSYRTSQTIDDVYYSPSVSNDNGYVSNSNDDGDYVSVQGDEDANSYGYRNDVQEDWYIRRGINNSFYRNSFSLSFGYGGGFYNPYDPFYSPFFPPFNPISYYGYAGMWDPYYFNHSWLSHVRYPYGYGLTYPLGNYSPYNVPYGNYSYGYFNPYPYAVRRDNGPRVLNLNAPRTGISTPIRGQNNDDRPNLAPIRVMRNNGNVQNGTIERRVSPRNNNSTSPVNNNRNVRKFKAPRNSDYYSPSPSENRRPAPSRNNDVSPAPNRTFERTSPPPSPSVDRTPSTPPSNNGGGNKSAPVRKF